MQLRRRPHQDHLDAELIYWDDQAEKNYLVRTFKVTVHDLKGQWETWQIAPDDVLATAWMYMAHDDDNSLLLTPDSQTFDKRIVPAALKKSMGFELPWPAHPKVKTIQASYPPKSGMPDPK